MELEFDMIGADASVANSFRRILLAEVRLTAVIFDLFKHIFLSIVIQGSHHGDREGVRVQQHFGDPRRSLGPPTRLDST